MLTLEELFSGFRTGRFRAAKQNIRALQGPEGLAQACQAAIISFEKNLICDETSFVMTAFIALGYSYLDIQKIRQYYISFLMDKQAEGVEKINHLPFAVLFTNGHSSIEGTKPVVLPLVEKLPDASTLERQYLGLRGTAEIHTIEQWISILNGSILCEIAIYHQYC